jgi:transcriptional regulator with XRE-family HTH domain
MAKKIVKDSGYNAYFLSIFPKNIKRLRIERGWSQKTLALKCGYSTDWIGHVEAGFTIPSVQGIIALSRCFEVPMADFFLEENTSDPYKPLVDFAKRYKLTPQQVEKLIDLGKILIKKEV